MRYFLHLAYKGTNYRGWQSQPNAISVQEVLEDKLSVLLKQKISLHPCGRTDAGVHARQFFAHFNYYEPIKEGFVFKMNKLLPNDIAIFEIIPIQRNANAQHDALSRTYQYHFHLHKNPFLEEGSSWYPIKELNIKAMQKAVELMAYQNDFRSMCLQADAHKSTICTIQNVRLHINSASTQFCFEITANRFLRGMVRLLAARVIDIGCQKLTLAELKTSFETGNRVQYHTAAYPQGLYLTKVEYPFLKRDTVSTSLF